MHTQKGGIGIKHQGNNGFTLVEIIVVLVIIAILAASILPALTGYIKEAGDKVAISETRTYLVAAQALSSELYGLGVSTEHIRAYINNGNRVGIPSGFTKTVASVTGNDYYADYNKLKQIIIDSTTGTVMIIELHTSNGRKVMYNAGTMSIKDN